jgi:hypothetical protein
MSRTYRRKNQTQCYHGVLCDFVLTATENSRLMIVQIAIPARSVQGRRLLAKYHSDHAFIDGQAPHWFRKLFKRRQRMGHLAEIARWLKDSGYPVQCDPRTRHSATWEWR